MRRRGKQRPRALAGATCALCLAFAVGLCFAAGLASCQSPPAAPTLMPGIAEAEQVSLQDEWVWRSGAGVRALPFPRGADGGRLGLHGLFERAVAMFGLP